jgi:hypothetical protein
MNSIVWKKDFVLSMHWQKIKPYESVSALWKKIFLFAGYLLVFSYAFNYVHF